MEETEKSITIIQSIKYVEYTLTDLNIQLKNAKSDTRLRTVKYDIDCYEMFLNFLTNLRSKDMTYLRQILNKNNPDGYNTFISDIFTKIIKELHKIPENSLKKIKNDHEAAIINLKKLRSICNTNSSVKHNLDYAFYQSHPYQSIPNTDFRRVIEGMIKHLDKFNIEKVHFSTGITEIKRKGYKLNFCIKEFINLFDKHHVLEKLQGNKRLHTLIITLIKCLDKDYFKGKNPQQKISDRLREHKKKKVYKE